jgi:hypothetical protein
VRIKIVRQNHLACELHRINAYESTIGNTQESRIFTRQIVALCARSKARDRVKQARQYKVHQKTTQQLRNLYTSIHERVGSTNSYHEQSVSSLRGCVSGQINQLELLDYAAHFQRRSKFHSKVFHAVFQCQQHERLTVHFLQQMQ